MFLSLCCLCFNSEESLNHILLHCQFVSKGWAFFPKVVCLGFLIFSPSRADDWLEVLNGGWFKGLARLL